MKNERLTIRKRDDPRRGKTNLEKLRKLTDEEINASIANDPDWADFKDADWSEAVDLSPKFHPAMGRVPASFEPIGLGGATGRGAEPSV
jgi:hypothetical protein